MSNALSFGRIYSPVQTLLRVMKFFVKKGAEDFHCVRLQHVSCFFCMPNAETDRRNAKLVLATWTLTGKVQGQASLSWGLYLDYQDHLGRDREVSRQSLVEDASRTCGSTSARPTCRSQALRFTPLLRLEASGLSFTPT